jgi:competence ComEA-like helix-hairpin-helix protein
MSLKSSATSAQHAKNRVGLGLAARSALFFVCCGAVLLLPSVASAALININTAGAAELTTLKGIGSVKAQAIMEYRERTPFLRIEDILQVKGIGAATFRDIKDSITVGEVKVSQPAAKALSEKPALEEQKVTERSLPAAVAYTESTATPLWWYLLGLMAIAGLGVAGAWYARLLSRAETAAPAGEFEIIE